MAGNCLSWPMSPKGMCQYLGLTITIWRWWQERTMQEFCSYSPLSSQKTRLRKPQTPINSAPDLPMPPIEWPDFQSVQSVLISGKILFRIQEIFLNLVRAIYPGSFDPLTNGH